MNRGLNFVSIRRTDRAALLPARRRQARSAGCGLIAAACVIIDGSLGHWHAPLVRVRAGQAFQQNTCSARSFGERGKSPCQPSPKPDEGEEMTGENSAEVPNMRQRTVLQHLSLTDWKKVDRLPVKASELTLSRLLQHGWIESRGEKQHTAVGLTPAGLKAMRSPI